MKTLTTKAAVKPLKNELGARVHQMDLVVLENESARIQVEATTDQIKERLDEGKVVDSDVISDQLMEVDFLRRENLLEKEK